MNLGVLLPVTEWLVMSRTRSSPEGVSILRVR